jgi:amino-acid N-acetyltransferase
VLLTETAKTFFEREGYSVIDRASAPEPVRTSAEFRTLCPQSATCLSKRL